VKDRKHCQNYYNVQQLSHSFFLLKKPEQELLFCFGCMEPVWRKSYALGIHSAVRSVKPKVWGLHIKSNGHAARTVRVCLRISFHVSKHKPHFTCVNTSTFLR